MLCGTLVHESKQPVVFPARLHPASVRPHRLANPVEIILSSLSSAHFSVETMMGPLFPQALVGNQQDKGKKEEEEG